VATFALNAALVAGRWQHARGISITYSFKKIKVLKQSSRQSKDKELATM